MIGRFRTSVPSRTEEEYAPGAYRGYGSKPIPAVREYMDAKK